MFHLLKEAPLKIQLTKDTLNNSLATRSMFANDVVIQMPD